jgi:hypothetical protein
MPMQPMIPHSVLVRTRREFLSYGGAGFGVLALAYLLDRTGSTAAADPLHGRPVSGRPHVAPKAKSVIFLFMDGGPSHLDLFDPKPMVNKLAGQPLPASFERPITPMGVSDNPILPTQRRFSRHGRSGIEVSDWLPNIARHVDKMTVIRSCWANGLNHVNALLQMNTGSTLGGRPSLGAWVAYGLGSENENLPAFVILTDRDRLPPGGPRNWGTGFMPASYQGTRFRNGPVPILNLETPRSISLERQRRKLELLGELNRRHAESRADETELSARIASYELAFRMQAQAPEAVDFRRETEETTRLFGIDAEPTAPVGRKLLLARRLVERGVRFVQVYCGSGGEWDAHSKIEANHSKLCQATDRPIAGLLEDLERRGLLEETLVIWGGEFGRTPMSEKGDGRDHNPYGFSMWLAGGGVPGGQVVGATDELGLFAVENKIHVHDIHATVLRLLGLDHLKLTYRHNGRDERPTIDAGRIIRQIVSA